MEGEAVSIKRYWIVDWTNRPQEYEAGEWCLYADHEADKAAAVAVVQERLEAANARIAKLEAENERLRKYGSGWRPR